MLPKQYRLPAAEIPTLAYRGHKTATGLFDLRFIPDEKLPNPLFAISVSVKIDKRATIRNLIKRRFRAGIIKLLKSKQVRKGKYLVVVRSPEIAKEADFTPLLSKVIQ